MVVSRSILAVFVGVLVLALSVTAVSAAVPARGGGAPQPAAPLEVFRIEGVERHAIVAVPEDYAPERPHMLVFGFHGRTNDHARVRRYFGLERSAKTATIFVYPAGLRDEEGLFTWSDAGDAPHELRDFALFDTMLEHIARDYCIDLGAVFVAGHSLGATFANSLACARAEHIRGLASVAGGIDTVECSEEVAALLFHNALDPAVPVDEGRRARDALIGDQDDPHPVAARQLHDFTCNHYGEDGEPVLWCLHDRDHTRSGRFHPHQWPPGAAEAIMGFFEQLADR